MPAFAVDLVERLTELADQRPERDRPWVMRTYAGHSSASESNALYRRNLAKGQTGLSVAFDLPTQTGYDSDHPLAKGEVGKVGVAIDSLEDMLTLFDGIPLDALGEVQRRALHHLGAGHRLAVELAEGRPLTRPGLALYGLPPGSFGFIYLPALDELYVAEKGAGAFLNGKRIHVTGIDCHIGSQITELGPYLDTVERVLRVVAEGQEIVIPLKNADGSIDWSHEGVRDGGGRGLKNDVGVETGRVALVGDARERLAFHLLHRLDLGHFQQSPRL